MKKTFEGIEGPTQTSPFPWQPGRGQPARGLSERAILVTDLGIIFLASLTGLIWLVGWQDNPQALTANGVFKAMSVRDWLDDYRAALLDRSNFHYYPFMAVLCHLLDLVGVLPGDPRRQLAIINCLFGAISLCIIYLLVRSISRRRSVAWAAVAFHLAGGFFLNLSISNEDIIPSYTFLLGSMALASIWFVAPTPRRIAIVSLIFTLAWLFEWRLMFPTLPALLVALLLAPGTGLARLGRIALFLAIMVAIPEIAKQLWGPHDGNVGTVRDLLWTGKAVESGWAGFSAGKFVFLGVGVGEYLLGGSNLANPALLSHFQTEILVSILIVSAVAIGSLVLVWRDSGSLSTRVLAAVFGITFLAGEISNLYSQPQDPQMQINAMIWLTIGWAAIVAAATRRYGQAIPKVAMALAALLMSYNIYRMSPSRGADSQWRNALQRIESQIDPTRTVFLVHGFEQFVSETFYEWRGEWAYFKKLGPAPTLKPKVKLLLFVNGPIHQPTASGAELADDLIRQIDHAMDLGYQVVADYVWDLPEASFTSSMSTIADASKASALYNKLHEKFTAAPLYVDPLAGAFVRLHRAN